MLGILETSRFERSPAARLNKHNNKTKQQQSQQQQQQQTTTITTTTQGKEKTNEIQKTKAKEKTYHYLFFRQRLKHPNSRIPLNYRKPECKSKQQQQQQQQQKQKQKQKKKKKQKQKQKQKQKRNKNRISSMSRRLNMPVMFANIASVLVPHTHTNTPSQATHSKNTPSENSKFLEIHPRGVNVIFLNDFNWLL